MAESKQKTGKIIGYARVSTGDQDLRPQITALEKYGCEIVFSEKASGGRMDRRELTLALQSVHAGDTFVVWKLDRLARSLNGLKSIIDQLSEWEARFVSLTDHIDATTASGRLMFHVMAAMAEFERDIISERTKMGMAARKARGEMPGPKHSIADNPKRLKRWLELRDSGLLDEMTVREITAAMNDADRKAPKITTLQTYRNWRRRGFPGAPKDYGDDQEV